MYTPNEERRHDKKEEEEMRRRAGGKWGRAGQKGRDGRPALAISSSVIVNSRVRLCVRARDLFFCLKELVRSSFNTRARARDELASDCARNGESRGMNHPISFAPCARALVLDPAGFD